MDWIQVGFLLEEEEGEVLFWSPWKLSGEKARGNGGWGLEERRELGELG